MSFVFTREEKKVWRSEMSLSGRLTRCRGWLALRSVCGIRKYLMHGTSVAFFLQVSFDRWDALNQDARPRLLPCRPPSPLLETVSSGDEGMAWRLFFFGQGGINAR